MYFHKPHDSFVCVKAPVYSLESFIFLFSLRGKKLEIPEVFNARIKEHCFIKQIDLKKSALQY